MFMLDIGRGTALGTAARKPRHGYCNTVVLCVQLVFNNIPMVFIKMKNISVPS